MMQGVLVLPICKNELMNLLRFISRKFSPTQVAISNLCQDKRVSCRSVFEVSTMPKEHFGQASVWARTKLGHVCRCLDSVRGEWDSNQDLWKSSLAKKLFWLFPWTEKTLWKLVLAIYILIENMVESFKKITLTVTLVIEVSRAEFCA